MDDVMNEIIRQRSQGLEGGVNQVIGADVYLNVMGRGATAPMELYVSSVDVFTGGTSGIAYNLLYGCVNETHVLHTGEVKSTCSMVSAEVIEKCLTQDPEQSGRENCTLAQVIGDAADPMDVTKDEFAPFSSRRRTR